MNKKTKKNIYSMNINTNRFYAEEGKDEERR
jgi:hypothetical protein